MSENTFRLQHQRKEHQKHVRELLAQAIVNKAVDMERSRQVAVRKDVERIAKVELVRRVKVIISSIFCNFFIKLAFRSRIFLFPN